MLMFVFFSFGIFGSLEDVGMVLVRGVKDKGDIKGNVALKEAYDLGLCVK